MAAPCWDAGIEVLSATPDWVRLTVRCDITTADRLVQFLRGFKDPNVPEGIILAFKEILLNAIEYGGNFDPSQRGLPVTWAMKSDPTLLRTPTVLTFLLVVRAKGARQVSSESLATVNNGS